VLASIERMSGVGDSVFGPWGWSPDGATLAIAPDRVGLRLFGRDGHEKSITAVKQVGGLAWAGDSRLVLIEHWTAGNAWWTLDVKSGAQSAPVELNAAPKRIAARGDRVAIAGTEAVWLGNADGSGVSWVEQAALDDVHAAAKGATQRRLKERQGTARSKSERASAEEALVRLETPVERQKGFPLWVPTIGAPTLNGADGLAFAGGTLIACRDRDLVALRPDVEELLLSIKPSAGLKPYFCPAVVRGAVVAIVRLGKEMSTLFLEVGELSATPTREPSVPALAKATKPAKPKKPPAKKPRR
jgi:hypothetical protein